MELARRGYTVSIGTLKKGEVDFVARREDRLIYIQVTQSMIVPSILERELMPLQAIADAHPKRVLTLDR